MKKLIFIIAFLITSFTFAQGGPKVDVVKFRGEVSTAVRNGFTVPANEYWLIYNTTTGLMEIGSSSGWSTVGDGLQEGANSIPSGVSLNQAITNKIEILPDLNGNPTIRIIGGNQDDAVYQIITDDSVNWSFASSANEYNINPAGETNANDLVRKNYVDNQISAIPSSSDDQTATEVSTNTSSFNGFLSSADDNVQKALETLDDITLSGADNSLSEANQTIPNSTFRDITIGTNSGLVIRQSNGDDEVLILQNDNVIVGNGVRFNAPLVTSNFFGTLSSADSTIQKAFDTLDNLVLEASNVSLLDDGANFTSTNVEGALAELAASSSVDSGQGVGRIVHDIGMYITYNDNNVTIGGAATAKKIINEHYTNDTINLGGVTLKNIIFSSELYADSLTIKRNADEKWIMYDSIISTSDGIVIKNKDVAGFRYVKDSSAVKVWRVYAPEYSIYNEVPTFLTPPLASNPNPELIVNNAFSFSSEDNSMNNTDNQVFNSNLSATIVSLADTSNGYGNYVARITSTADGSTSGRAFLNGIVNGEIYEFAILVSNSGGAQDRMLISNATPNSSTFYPNAAYTLTTGEVTATGTQFIFNLYPGANGGVTGDTMDVKLSVKLKND